ncbi:Wzz/FepE/Etk N-terminal domain-containing protein [Danxiaibacter flavus]|uniref:Wzz/FepE/Etk N-terminal domain-containing protein n=1 Tax=Danxiaibacter flavus TaxID=3049108 RepID=A0ABV3ZC99_9BACT|nr:Wzz/FepE/Etk N-terminal domain-containing protein [Chitinophagaceae bacterium DXS]
MELIYLLNALLRKKWIIIGCFLVAVVTAFLFTMNLKTLYKSSAQIATGFTASEQIKLENENFNTAQIDVKFNNIIENLTSPKVVQLLSYDLILHDLSSKSPFIYLSEKQKSQDDYKAVNIPTAIKVFTQKLDDMEVLDADVPEDMKLINFLTLYGYDVETLTGNISVSRINRTDYIGIDVLSESPDLSAFAVNTLVQELNRYYSQTKKSSTDVSIASLDSAVQAKKTILDEKLTAKSAYLSSHGIVDVNMESGNKLSQVSSYQSQLADEKSKLQNLNYRIGEYNRLIETAKTTGQKTVSGSTVINANNDEYIRLRKQYNELNAQYIQKGSTDIDMKRKLDDLSAQMKALNFTSESKQSIEGATVSVDELVQKKLDAEGDLKATREKIGILESNLSNLNGGLNGMAASGAEIEKLTTEITIAQTEYSNAKDKLNSVANYKDTYAGFKQTIYGQPALIPEPSKRWLIVALAGAAALFFSVIVIILIEYFDQSIKSPAQFNRLTQLPLIGSINYIDKFDGDIFAKVNNLSKDEGRNNVFKELLRKLRYEIESSGKRIFLFTSTEPQQGKTTLIQALSYSLSLGKKKVLIIDTNFCNNDLTNVLHARPSLEKFYVNGKPFNIEDVKALVTPTSVEGVETIGCGAGDYTPSEILPKNHLLNYLHELLTVYDYIFLEGAPLNSFTDTKELINYSDGMIAVFASDKSLSETDKESIEYLRQHSEKFIGAILNKVQVENLDM